jgi:tetratricopeptide (TPR) repeat protein
MNPNDTFVLLMLGTLEAGVGEHERAIEHGQQMLRLNPRQSYGHMTYNLLAFASFGAKQYVEGIGWASRALNDMPRLLFAHLHLATCLIGTGILQASRFAPQRTEFSGTGWRARRRSPGRRIPHASGRSSASPPVSKIERGRGAMSRGAPLALSCRPMR